MPISRRAVILGGVAAAASITTIANGAAAHASPELAAAALSATYAATTALSGARWHSCVTDLMSGRPVSVIDDDADNVIEGASVQKLAVATALLDAVDRGALSLSQTVELTEDVVAPGSGIYRRQTAFGDRLTLSNVVTTMLQVSDTTAVRLIASVLPGAEVNRILASKGFSVTRVEPLEGHPSRFWSGVTTPREINALLTRLVIGELLAPETTKAFLRVLNWSAIGYVDGIRRNMSSSERARFATKHGADEDKRHEAGILFDPAGAPQLVYAYFADHAPDPDNYGATNPVVQAHSALGRAMLDHYTALSPLPPVI